MHFYLLYKLELYTSNWLIRPHRPPTPKVHVPLITDIFFSFQGAY
jgi:hypothetical protein